MQKEHYKYLLFFLLVIPFKVFSNPVIYRPQSEITAALLTCLLLTGGYLCFLPGINKKMKLKNVSKRFYIVYPTTFIFIIFCILLFFWHDYDNKPHQPIRTITHMQSLEIALKSFALDTGSFPNTSTGLEALLVRPADVSEETWDGPYFEKQYIPKDPWGRPYVYRSPGIHNDDFDLYSLGKDGIEGTKDDVVNWIRRE